MSAQDKKLVLENSIDEVVRTLDWRGDKALVVKRLDTKRLGVYSSIDFLEDENIEFETLTHFTRKDIEKGPIVIPNFGQLRLVESVEKTIDDEYIEKASSRSWWLTLSLVVILGVGSLSLSFLGTEEPPAIEEELKKHVVKIIKLKPIRKTVAVSNKSSLFKKTQKTTKTQVKVKKSIKRVGALAVLGGLNKSKQKGGLNLGAIKTTAGPGLGGTQGSGGVQTTLYGKGLVAAPVGVGGKITGAGGYGTKGKGGGKAGYGKRSLIGSSGASSIPLGKEAIIEGGLDKDLIASVIAKRMGEVRFCYEQGLQSNPSLAGRVAVDFTIKGSGRISTASVANTSLNSKLVEDCILMRLRSWKFPLPEGGLDVKVSYPFMLRRLGKASL